MSGKNLRRLRDITITCKAIKVHHLLLLSTHFTFTMILQSSLSLALSVVFSLVTISSAGTKRVTKQVGTSINGPVSSTKDHQSAETHHHGFGLGHDHGHHGHELGLGGHGHGHGHGHDYFQYQHNPEPYKYEFGYRRGNDYHFQERYEKGKDWTFKTKVKWGDKYGGYGEHYWDYNHADKSYHGDDHGHGHGHGHGGHDGHYSEPVVSYEPNPGSNGNGKANGLNKRQSDDKKSQKTEQDQQQQQPMAPARARSVPQELSLDPVTGKVTDESSGKTYWLKPASSESEGVAGQL